jgi:hypothetical protein
MKKLERKRAAQALFAAFLWFACAAAAQECRVLDPELQGAYSGPCAAGLAQGRGTAIGSAEYRGEFQAGRKHGKGVKTWSNGDRYEGDFLEDRKEGAGIYVWGRGPWAGERYEGGYVDDRRHGFGVYRWPSGDRPAHPDYAGAREVRRGGARRGSAGRPQGLPRNGGGHRRARLDPRRRRGARTRSRRRAHRRPGEPGAPGRNRGSGQG